MFNMGNNCSWDWLINLIILLVVFDFLFQILCGNCICNTGNECGACGC